MCATRMILPGLTWDEVEKCEAKFADLLANQNIPIPSKEDFDAADLNEDGTLMFEEWEEWVEEKQEEEEDSAEEESTEEESEEEEEESAEEESNEEESNEEESAENNEETTEEV
eukprot:TRINITY_DN3001_c0_g1_i1.p1 TRINITY_DN3001_c0_g1~~TRINITY_DN3001_c0_g1_i1.p1  ORF type:complete len:114 (-),score=50.59 TRINITY_DN3001_c0_g1_i1:101-442(-)